MPKIIQTTVLKTEFVQNHAEVLQLVLQDDGKQYILKTHTEIPTSVGSPVLVDLGPIMSPPPPEPIEYHRPPGPILPRRA